VFIFISPFVYSTFSPLDDRGTATKYGRVKPVVKTGKQLASVGKQ
jgi:hypothetical protein